MKGRMQSAVQIKVAILLACRKVTAGPVLAPLWLCTKLQPGSITQSKLQLLSVASILFLSDFCLQRRKESTSLGLTDGVAGQLC
jgi:hypothetical protein